MIKLIAGCVFSFSLIVGTLALRDAALDPSVSPLRFMLLFGVFGLLFCASGLIVDFDTLQRSSRIKDAEQELLKDVSNIRTQAAHADRIVRNLEKRAQSVGV